MRFTYSPTADALAIELDPKAQSVRTVPVTGDIVQDFDAQGRLIGIEILNASQYYDAAALARLGSPEELLTLVEAGAEAGLSPTTLRVQIRNGRLHGVKRGRDLMVARHELWNYLARRRGEPEAPARPATKRRVKRLAKAS